MSEIYKDSEGRVLKVGDEVRYEGVDAEITGFSGEDADWDGERYIAMPVTIFIKYQVQHQDGDWEMVEDEVETGDDVDVWDRYRGAESEYRAYDLTWLDPVRARVVL